MMYRYNKSRKHLSESKYDKDFNKFLNEEMDSYELKLQIIKALNQLDALSRVASEGQTEEYIKPAFKLLLDFKKEVQKAR